MEFSGTFARPSTSRPDGVRTCWRCGIDFTSHARLRPDAPCGDCRAQVPKPADGWWKKENR